jgi:polysaccharide lyase family 4-like protein
LEKRWVTVPLGFLLLMAGTACDRAKSAFSKSDSGVRTNGEAMAATAKAAQAPAYTVRPLDTFGRVTGTVEIDGEPPPDTVFQPAGDPLICGTAFTRRGIERTGNRAVGVVVWIDGLRSGKPLPVERRFELVNERCLLWPEVQTALAGGTLNVRNLDATEHRTRITRRAGGEVLATIRETDEGQVVPNEHVLSKPGVLTLSCDTHPWTRAWIAVFDQPYFATTGRDGAFSIDSIPPGRYQLQLWHPRLGAAEESVTIEAGKAAVVTLRAKGLR